MVNNKLGPYFETKKGLQQGDPLFPILFNIVVDMLAIIIARAKEDGWFKGATPQLVEDGLPILQHAYITMLFLDHDIEQTKKHEVASM